MKFIDWFAGIGGFRRGMELAGHEMRVRKGRQEPAAPIEAVRVNIFFRVGQILRHFIRVRIERYKAVEHIGAESQPCEEFERIAQDSFSELCTLLGNSKKKRDLNGYSSRMLRICLALMVDGISPGFSVAWTRVGTMRSGRFSTLKISEFHRTGKGYSLSDILEDEVDEKYYLYQAQVEKILFA